MSRSTVTTIHLDERSIEALEQYKRRLDAEAGGFAPTYSLPALARHAIRQWCNHVAPKPTPCEQESDSEE